MTVVNVFPALARSMFSLAFIHAKLANQMLTFHAALKNKISDH